MDKVEGLIKLQDALIEQLNDISVNAQEDIEANRSVRFYERRIATLNDLYDKFQENHHFICQAEDNNSTTAYNDQRKFRNFEKQYFKLIAELEDKVSLLSTAELNNSSNSTHITTVPSAKPQIKLPPIQLPKFDGTYKSWRSFRDLYVNLIHNNNEISEIEKLHYLKSCTSGEAARIIRPFDIIAANYQKAWFALVSRFNNNRVLINTQLEKLCKFTPMKSESAQGMKDVLSNVEETLHELETLRVNTENWDPLITYLTLQRLPPETRELWEIKQSSKTDLPTFKELIEFLEARFRVLEAVNPPKRSNVFLSQNNKNNNQEIKCSKCNSDHRLFNCTQFKTLSANEKLNFVKKHKLCMNCLAMGHRYNDCKSKYTCNTCKKKHHSLLHNSLNTSNKIESKTSAQSTQNDTGDRALPATNTSEKNESKSFFSSNVNQVLLSTALVRIRSAHGHNEILRALIDSGSQTTFITAAAAKRLQLKTLRTNQHISGLNESSTLVATSQTQFDLESVYSTFKRNVNALVVKGITNNLPTYQIETIGFDHLKNLNLADPDFSTPGKVDLLLGAEVYAAIIQEGIRRSTKPNYPIAINTELGWIVTGSISHTTNTKTFMIHAHEHSLDTQLRRFWEQEEGPNTTHETPEDKLCEEIYHKTTKRLSDGSYQVDLPFKTQSGPKLGESRRKAISQFLSLERKFLQNPEYYSLYKKNIEEYFSAGHITQVNQDENVMTYYMPHHGVLKESTTTKLRTVFNASSKSSNGMSLNEQMFIGPTIQSSLMTTLLKWRKFRYAVTADIEKMYRMIHINPQQYNLQRIVWRNTSTEPIKDYALTTVTFGTAAAPFLAIRTLHQLANDECQNYPLAAEIIKNHMYVDDLCYSHHDLNELIRIQRELRELLKRGGFNLRKWIANDSTILNSIPIEDREIKESLTISDMFNIKTLGIKWNPVTDNFNISVKTVETDEKITKRRILSEIASLFDPFGWLAPCIMTAKIIMQQLWISRCDWDERPSEILVNKWKEFLKNLSCISSITIPRWLSITTNETSITIHGFCDASTVGYAAVVYIQVKGRNESKVTLVASKTKVAPIKPISLPRLELCGATLLSKLVKNIKKDLKLENTKTLLWSDSTITLSWIQKHPSKWKTYVANRIAEIHENSSPLSWRYIPGKDNPADSASRGQMPDELVHNTLWWAGPTWLNDESLWPKQPEISDSVEELKKHKVLTTIMEPEIISRYSSYLKLLRVTAYCFRFINNCRSTQKIKSAHLTKEEITQTEIAIIRLIQQSQFTVEIKYLKAGKQIQRDSRILNLNPFIDEQNLLRVGGRLQKSELPYDEKHPVILPANHAFSKLLINYIHEKTCHGGVQLTLNTIRQRFWLINAKNMIRHQLHKCIKCFKVKPSNNTQLMHELPTARVTQSYPFQHVGIDFAGPIDMKVSSLRNAKVTSVYICLFICLCTKAVHLELVSNLSANAFIASFNRFTNRRGLCSDIYSDCGTNFVKANKIMFSKQVSEEIADILANNRIKWHFNPPSAPHFGGLWESHIKLVKTHLKKTLQNTKLTFEGLYTVLCNIEACINSRPLIPINIDPDNDTIITPGHFLIQRNLQVVPETNQMNDTIPTRQWQFLKQLQQNFWRNWSKNYLNQLQTRYKWKQVQENLEANDIVLIKQENYPPLMWPLGRIVETYPGSDKLVRTALIKIGQKTYLRPIIKLCKLPINQS